MIITEDEGAGALELLHTCLNLVPEDCWIEQPAAKVLEAGENGFEGKTIICYEADAAKDLLSRRLTEIELHGNLVQTKRQSTSKKPTAFVALTKNPKNPLLQNRYVTRVHVNADQESKTSRLESLVKKSDLDSQRKHKIESACLRTLLGRIKANPVDIDFADKIIKKDAATVQNIVPFIDSMFRILRNITRINNSPQLCPEELQAAFIGLDLEDLAVGDAVKEQAPFKATKVDYYYFLMIFGDMFKVNNDFLSPRQLAIYEAIFSQNIEYQENSRKHRNSTHQQMLNDYPETGYNKGWATREAIEARLKDLGVEFSYSTLHNEIQVLLKYDLIKARKVPNRTNKFAYVATRPLGDESPVENDFSKINAPQFKESTVEIYNFLTDKTEKI
ncbi:MAG: hypothetical protein B6I30_09955 [Desulfobacteraceae bacterium 4572_187]|nr:MAG: hypothetical protein B6I30_09955 [Desulfobacteraceae bacterium 4572_187]